MMSQLSCLKTCMVYSSSNMEATPVSFVMVVTLADVEAALRLSTMILIVTLLDRMIWNYRHPREGDSNTLVLTTKEEIEWYRKRIAELGGENE